MNRLNKIRIPLKTLSLHEQIIRTLGVLLLGILMGAFSKYLEAPIGKMPSFLKAIDRSLDFHNFLGGFAPWIVIAVFISVRSRTPLRAAVNVFCFFCGMVASYYLYSYFIAGFYPKNYARMWILFTLASPFLASLCWYAVGQGSAAFVLSAAILGVLMNTAFYYGMFYIDVSSWLNVIMLLLGVLILHRSFWGTCGMIALGAVLAVMMETFIPFHIW